MVRVLGNALSQSDALQGVTITPELRVIIVQSRSYRISIGGGPTIDPSTGDVSGGRGGVEVDTPYGRVRGDVSGSRGRGTGTITYTPGDFRPETRDCTRRSRALRMRCERISVTPAVPSTPAVTRRFEKRVYLLFEYEQSSPVRKVLIGEGRGQPSDSTVSDVRDLGTQGYRVRSIQGFASPEGSRAPSRRRGGFVGNVALSRNRAIEAQSWFETNCPDCEGQAVTPIAGSELFSPMQTPEVEGRDLERSATGEFLRSDDPLRPGSEQERQRLAQAPLRSRRDSVYQLLRRADIVLDRDVVVQPARPGSPRRETPTPVSCPSEVRDAVRQHLNIHVGTGSVIRR